MAAKILLVEDNGMKIEARREDRRPEQPRCWWQPASSRAVTGAR